MAKPLYLKNLFAVITVLSLTISFSSYAQDAESKIDSLLLEKYAPDAPGADFLIARNGEIIYKKAFGLANLELGVPMKTDNVFEIGSMTKQFTAISILMLLEKGELNLDDEITSYIPDYPTKGHKITIHHLLTHTSGIKSFTSIKGLNAIANNDLTPLELIDFFKNETMDFAPGEAFKYSNSGYVILGYIIESVSGQSYADFVEEHIFKRLKMTSSQYASHKKVVQRRASGYSHRDGYINTRRISFTIPYASGSLMSSVDDMFLWQEAIKNNVLISEETTEKAFTNYSLNSGEPINYGYGWHLKANDGMLSREHGGSIFGFKSMGVYLPASDIYVIGLTNCDCNSPTKVTRQIAELVAKD
jgi:CubicO group peptidase (beta-lactamase class C family)